MSYKNLLNELGRIGVAHDSIKSIGYGLLSQLVQNIDTAQEPEYIRFYIVPGNTTFLQGQIRYDLSIVIADRIEEDLSNQVDVLNDTLLVCEDIFTVIKNSYSEENGNFSLYYDAEFGANINPFLERFTTYLGGWTLNISITEQFDYNACILPVDTLDLPTTDTLINYKQMTEDLLNINNSHKQVNSTGFGNEYLIQADLATDVRPRYPKVFISPDVTTLEEGQITYNFNYIVASRLEEDFSNQMDLMSDTQEIARDIFVILLQSQYYAQYNVVCSPFLHEYQDVLGGWGFTLTLTLPKEYNRCLVPINKFKLLKWINVSELWNSVTRHWDNV